MEVKNAIMFSVPLLPLLALSLLLMFLLVVRTLYLLRSIRKARQMKDPRTTIKNSSYSANRKEKSLKTLIVLGSGGHTTEMLDLIKNLNPNYYGPIVLVVANTDTTSLQRVQAYPYDLPIQNKANILDNMKSERNEQQVYRIPRSREVGQSYISSIFTTCYSFVFAFWLVGYQVQPDLVLVNGPGTCLPIAISAFFLRIVGWKTQTKIVFIESFCRVTSISLTGKLLYPVVDLFAVCWEQLQEKYPLTYLVTSFIPRAKSAEKVS